MKNVAVMFGGRSVEHEVSIVSALQAIRHFDEKEYRVFPVYITKENEFYYGSELESMENYKDIPALLNRCDRVVFTKNEGEVRMRRFPSMHREEDVLATIDVAFPIVHGTNVEDGILQGFLRTLDLPFVGCDVLSSAVGMDKYVMKVLLKSEGYPVLDGILLVREQGEALAVQMDRVEAWFCYPVFVKPANLGSSVGIAKAHDRAELEAALKNAFLYSQRVLVEPAIEQLQEINCAVLGKAGEVLVSECEEPILRHEFLSFEDKYIGDGKTKGTKSKGMKTLSRRIPANISAEEKEQISKIASEVFTYLDCNGVVRMDFMINKQDRSIWLNEINTIPGSLAFYLWEPIGIPYSELLSRLIRLGLERYQNEKNVAYSIDTHILPN